LLIAFHIVNFHSHFTANKHWNHPIAIDGNFEDKDCFIYHLEKHLHLKFGLTLKTFDNWNQEKLGEQSLWGLKEDAMSIRFRIRSEHAGYPQMLFSFHSLRAGFLCSAIIHSGINSFIFHFLFVFYNIFT
jgi:hypothetical protein